MSNTLVTYERSLIRRIVGVGLVIAAKVLPPLLYKLLHNTTFDGYRRLLRLLYLRHWIVYKLNNQQDQATKVVRSWMVVPFLSSEAMLVLKRDAIVTSRSPIGNSMPSENNLLIKP